jgi:hypothetical protein
MIRWVDMVDLRGKPPYLPDTKTYTDVLKQAIEDAFIYYGFDSETYLETAPEVPGLLDDKQRAFPILKWNSTVSQPPPPPAAAKVSVNPTSDSVPPAVSQYPAATSPQTIPAFSIPTNQFLIQPVNDGEGDVDVDVDDAAADGDDDDDEDEVSIYESPLMPKNSFSDNFQPRIFGRIFIRINYGKNLVLAALKSCYNHNY